MQIDRDLNANDLKLVPPTNLTPDQLKTWINAYRNKNNDFLDARLDGEQETRLEVQSLPLMMPWASSLTT